MQPLRVVAYVSIGEIDRSSNVRRPQVTCDAGIYSERSCRPLTASLQHRIGQSRIEFAGELEIQCAAGAERRASRKRQLRRVSGAELRLDPRLATIELCRG